MVSPEALEREAPIIDEEGHEVSKEHLRSVAFAYLPVIRFCNDWDEGRFFMTKSEYLALPAALIDAIGVIRAFKAGKND